MQIVSGTSQTIGFLWKAQLIEYFQKKTKSKQNINNYCCFRTLLEHLFPCVFAFVFLISNFPHNIYVVGLLFSRPWAPFAVWLEIEFPHPPVPPGPRCCYCCCYCYCYCCWLYPSPNHYWLYPSPQYIAHSARNSFADFERPLLAPQPTDLHDKKRGFFLKGCSTTWTHQNVNPGTLFKTKCENNLETQPQYT